MNNIDFNELRDRAYQCACDHGFHEVELSNEHFLCLVISELMEAVQADRKSRYFDKEKYKIGEYAECQGWLTNEEKFVNVFNRYIKDTVEDELADAVIRLLDLAGLRDIELACFPEEVNNNAESFKDRTFTECIYNICRMAIFPQICVNGSVTIYFGLNYLIASISGLAKHLDIDLPFFIEQKMKYNELRENKHGKRY